jgi:hypothetical protein
MRPKLHSLLAAALAVASLVLCPAAARAAEDGAQVVIEPLPDLMPGVASFPRVSPPDAERGRRIDAALRRADRRVRAAALDCRPPGAKETTWRRAVATTMRGPRFLAFLAEDEWFCGAYPDAGRLALVYDLRTGAPVDWARFLPAAMVQGTGTDTYADGTTVGLVSSRVLAGRYREAAGAECREVLDRDEPAFQLWPDARAGAVAIQAMGLPHAVAACAQPLAIPTAALRALGVNPALLDAIDAAGADGTRVR